MIVKKAPTKKHATLGCARSHNLVGRGQRLADVVQDQVRVDALRRGIINKLRGPHELLAHELVLRVLQDVGDVVVRLEGVLDR